MTARDLGTVVLRVFALYLLIQVASAIPALAATIIEVGQSVREGRSLLKPAITWPQSLLTFGTVWSVVLLAAVGFGLLKWAPRLAARLMPANSAAPVRIALGGELQATAISVVGIWMLATGAPRVAGTVMTIALAQKYRGEPFEFRYWERLGMDSLIALGVWILMGLWLCLGARGITNVIRSFATAGPVARAPGEGEDR